MKPGTNIENKGKVGTIVKFEKHHEGSAECQWIEDYKKGTHYIITEDHYDNEDGGQCIAIINLDGNKIKERMVEEGQFHSSYFQFVGWKDNFKINNLILE